MIFLIWKNSKLINKNHQFYYKSLEEAQEDYEKGKITLENLNWVKNLMEKKDKIKRRKSEFITPLKDTTLETEDKQVKKKQKEAFKWKNTINNYFVDPKARNDFQIRK